MSLAENQTRQSTIDWIEEGKTWSGKDGTEMREYKNGTLGKAISKTRLPGNEWMDEK